MQAAAAVEGGAERAFQAHPRHTDQGCLPGDGALAAAIGQQVQGTLHLGQGQPDAADAQAELGIAGAEFPAFGSGDRLQRQPELAAHLRLAQLQLRVGLDVHHPAGMLDAQGQAAADVAFHVGAGPVNHRRIGRRHRIAAAQGAVDLQFGLGDAAQRIAGHRGLTHRGVGRQPAPALTATLGDHCGQQVHAAQAGTEVGTGAQVQAQIGPADDQAIDRHTRAVAQALGLVALRLQEELTLGGQHIGHIQAHAAADARLTIDQRHLIEPVGGAHCLLQVAAPAVERELQPIGRQADRAACIEAQVALGLHRVAATYAHLAAQQHRAGPVAQAGLQTAGIDLALHIAQTDAHIGGVDAIDLVIERRHRQIAAERAQTLHRQIALVDDELLDMAWVVKAHRGGGAAQTSRHRHVQAAAQGVDGHRAGGVERDRIAQPLQADAARGAERVAAGSRALGRARDHQRQLAVDQADPGAWAADDAVDAGSANEQVVRGLLHITAQAGHHAGQIATCQSAAGHQAVDAGLVIGQHLHIAGADLRHGRQARLQQNADLAGQLAAQVQLLRPGGLSAQAQFDGVGQSVGQSQVEQLYLRVAQAGDGLACQLALEAGAPAFAERADPNVATADVAQALEGRLHLRGGGLGRQRRGGLPCVTEHKPLAGRRRGDALHGRGGGAVGQLEQLGLRSPLNLGDGAVHDRDVPPQGGATEADLPLLVASRADEAHTGVTAARGKAGAAAHRVEQCLPQDLGRGVEGDGAALVADAVVGEGQLEAALHGFVVQVDDLRGAPGLRPAGQRRRARAHPHFAGDHAAVERGGVGLCAQATDRHALGK